MDEGNLPGGHLPNACWESLFKFICKPREAKSEKAKVDLGTRLGLIRPIREKRRPHLIVRRIAGPL